MSSHDRPAGGTNAHPELFIGHLQLVAVGLWSASARQAGRHEVNTSVWPAFGGGPGVVASSSWPLNARCAATVPARRSHAVPRLARPAA
jgi:hypothetical protein